MTEAGWQACANWVPMLAFLGDRLSDRKARLYLAAGLRTLWEILYSDSSRQVVDVLERQADGTATDDALKLARWSSEAPTFGYDFDPEFLRRHIEVARADPTGLDRATPLR
jgi:hypothetical protein